MAKKSKQSSEERIDLKLIISGIIMFLILSLVSLGVTYIPNLFVRKDTSGQKPVDPDLNKVKIEQVKGESQIIQDKYSKTVNILERPLETPGFVTDSKQLTDYLAKNANTIFIRGDIDKAALYVKSTKLDVQKESIYFYMYDGTGFGGHLFPNESLSSDSGSDFLYDLTNLPYIQLPYSLSKSPQHKDVVRDVFDFNPTGTGERKYYIGGFVSTTDFPNSLERMEIRYTCKTGSDCLIVRSTN